MQMHKKAPLMKYVHDKHSDGAQINCKTKYINFFDILIDR